VVLVRTVFRELVAARLQADSAEEVIQKVGKMLLDHGFVKDTYIDAATAREKEFPTGLKLMDIAVAMPHTDPEHVNKPGVCVVQLEKPVIFSHMGSPDIKVEAEMIFMMAIMDPDAQVETLQKVLSVFQNPEVVKEFKNAAGADELFEVAMKHIG